MAGIDVLGSLADVLTEAGRSGPLRMVTATITEVGGDGRVRTTATGTAWLRRNQDATLAVDDLVVILAAGPLSIVLARI